MHINLETKYEFPLASVVICTRNRGELIVDTIETVLANTYPKFELLVVDQSTNSITENAVKRFCVDNRVRYIHTQTKGIGVSREIALTEARGEYVLFTDDDCIVPPYWVEVMTSYFADSPKTAVVFSNVAPGEHNPKIGTIPNWIFAKDRTIDSLPKYFASIGMGASMAMRRDTVLAMGGFEQFGPGSILQAGEDIDIAIRALLKGWYVQETTKVTVIHFGFRTYDQFRDVTTRDWVGTGAIYAKTLKSKKYSILTLIIYNLFIRNLLIPLSMIFKLQKPVGFRRTVALNQGFFTGLKIPVDKINILYIR